LIQQIFARNPRSGKDQNESINEAPKLERFYNQDAKIVLKDTILLHIGKGGGGSVQERMEIWQVDFLYCHPNPRPKKHSNAPNWLINIRDPVDRFYSAFNWRGL
jgi:hypothetical protein